MIGACLTEEQEDWLCFDIHTGSFTIWGSQPWSAFGMWCLLFFGLKDRSFRACTAWEMSQTFMMKWGWLVDDEVIRCSNFWRAERGEGPLIVPTEFRGSVLEEIA